jgi:hypothetical protein
MSYFERKLDYLNKHRIIYRRDPVTDIPTETFDWGKFYSEGTHECYTLFSSKAKINTYKSLKWHLYVLWYLNPQISPDEFDTLAKRICEIKNGFITFIVPPQLLNTIIYEISLNDLEEPPRNMMRKVIFRDNSGLTMNEKLSIVGQLIGKNRLSKTEIYEAMLYMHDDKVKITVEKLAEYLSCSARTIYRNMSDELKREKEQLNKTL